MRGGPATSPAHAPAPGAGSAAPVAGAPPVAVPGARPGALGSAAAPTKLDENAPENRQELVGLGGPGTLKTIPARYELVTKDDYVAVNLAGGPPTVYRGGFAPTAPSETREIRGRVLDVANRPVAGAIVVANDSIDVFGGQLLADAGATSATDGTFVIAKAPTRSVVQAFDRTGWSEVLVTTGAPIDLVIRGRGELRGKLSYDGHAESFDIVLARRGEPSFRVIYQSDPDGTYMIASLPIGAYTMTTGLAQSIQGGASKTLKREITIEAGKTTTVDLDQRSSTVVIATTRFPAGLDIETVEYSLLPGEQAANRKEATTRMRAGEGTGQLVGGIDAKIALQFHDVEPGAYHVCSAVNGGVLWGCTAVVVVDGDVAREVEIRVSAPAGK